MVSLDEVGTLPNRIYGDILHCFNKCNNGDFKAFFQHLLTQESNAHISKHSPIAPSWYGSSSSEPIISKIKHILCDANDYFNNFGTSNKWVLHCLVTVCFNCVEDHGLIYFKDPCDQSCITQNKTKFQEERNHYSADGCSIGDHPCGGQNNPKSSRP